MGGRRGTCWWVGNAHTVLVLELEKDHLKDPDVDGVDNIKVDLWNSRLAPSSLFRVVIFFHVLLMFSLFQLTFQMLL